MDKETLKITELDSLTSAPHMQMIKAALPYIQIPEQRFFSVFVKCSELERTLRLFEQPDGEGMGICSLEESDPSSPIDMLTAMKPYGTPEEQELIDLVINFMQGARLSREYRDSPPSTPNEPSAAPNPLEYIKDLLPPEQQTRLETVQLLLQMLRPAS